MNPARGNSVKHSPLNGVVEPRRSRSGRFGATLVEVLMSILIMAVGVVSVFTLFPIAVLRTIKATQDTNSKILKMNVEETVVSSPLLLTAFEPGVQFPGVPAPASYSQEWAPNTPYDGTAVPRVIVPTLKSGESIPRPLSMFFTVDNFTSGSTEPLWAGVTPTIGDGLGEWHRLRMHYIVDPWGWNVANDDGQPDAVRDSFGNKTDIATGAAAGFTGTWLPRIHGSISDFVTASNTVCMLDNWEEVFSGVAVSATTSATNSTITFPASVDLTGLDLIGTSRAVVTSTDGSKTAYHKIGSINTVGGVITLNAPDQISSYPTSFPQVGGNPDVGLVRIEVMRRRFSWFLTVRNDSTPEVKCVVVFNRNFATASEHAYDANFSDAAADVDVDGAADGGQHFIPPARDDWVKVVWDPAADPEPLIKTGNHIFDARNAAWYRVREIFARGTAGGVEHAILILDRSVRDAPAAGVTGRAILMPGIVEVFDL